FHDDLELLLPFCGLFRSVGFDAASFCDPQFRRVFSDEQHSSASECDDLRAQEAELAVADHGNAVGTRDRHAIENPTRGGEWFGEDCMFVRDVFWNGNKIANRKLKKLGVRAIASDDAENRAERTMS